MLGGLAAGLTGLWGAAKYLGSPAPRPRPVAGTTRLVERYGEQDRRQRGEWWVPPGSAEGDRHPSVVLVHGGYWRPQYDLSLEDAVAADLAGRGFLVWNVDYRAADAPWPATLEDVAAAHDHLLAGRYGSRVDPARTAVVGHSAGGHLALWLASRQVLPDGAPGAGPTAPVPALVVPQAPVAALAEASWQGLGGGAVDALLGGGPEAVPQRYAVADPLALLPTGVPSVLLHGRGDDVVPLSQSERYAAAARAAGDDSTVRVDAGGHFEHLDPRSAALAALREALARL